MCSSDLSQVTISEPSAVIAQATGTPALCYGTPTGTANANAAGGTAPYVFSWAAGLGNTSSINNLIAGNYLITVTDANGCTATSSATITQPTPINVNTLMQPVSCHNGANGMITASASGGTPAYAYNWFPSGGSNPQAGGLITGNYSVTVTDINGCTTSQTTLVTEQIGRAHV